MQVSPVVAGLWRLQQCNLDTPGLRTRPCAGVDGRIATLGAATTALAVKLSAQDR